MPHHGVTQRRHDRARPRCLADGELEPPLLARLLDLGETGDARLHLAHLARLLLARLGLRGPSVLVVVRALAHRVAHALRRPLPLPPSASHQVGLGRRELLEVLARVPPPHLALVEVRLVAAVDDHDRVLREVELDDRRHAAGEELPVVRDQHRAAAQALHEGLEPREAVEVEVVRRLVEQHDVEPAEQQRRQGHPCGLPAGQPRHQGVDVERETQVGQDLWQPFVEIGCARGHPAVEGHGVPVVGARLARPQLLGRGLHLRRRPRGPRAARHVVRDGLAGDPLVLLGQPAHEGVRRGGAHRPRQRRVDPGEQPQQRRLARAVRTHDADHVARGDGERQVVEQGAVGVPA